MNIKLLRTGGLIPVKKSAEIETNLTDVQLERLIKFLKSAPEPPRFKDGTNYILTAGDIVAHIDPDKVPEEFKTLLDQLKRELKFIK